MFCYSCCTPSVLRVSPPRTALRPRHKQPLRSSRIRIRIVNLRSGMLQSVGLVQDPCSTRIQGVSVEFRRRKSAVVRYAAPSAAAERHEAAFRRVPAHHRPLCHGLRWSGPQRRVYGPGPGSQSVDGGSTRLDPPSCRCSLPLRQRGKSDVGRWGRVGLQQYCVAPSSGKTALRDRLKPCRRQWYGVLWFSQGPPGRPNGCRGWTTVSLLVSVHPGRNIVWRRRCCLVATTSSTQSADFIL